MKSELSFLVSLLLEHKLTVATKKAVQARMVEVEQSMQPHNGNYPLQPRQAPGNAGFIPAFQVTGTNQQSPSTLALLEKHGMLPPASVGPVGAPVMPQQVAQPSQEAPVVNPVAINQALASRQALIESALSDPEGKRSKRTSGLKVGMR